MEIITKLSVSLTRDNDTVYVKAKQNDIGRGIEVTLVEHSTVYQLLDTDEVNAYVAKPDGKVVYNPCTVSDGKAVVELTQQMLAKDGYAKCEIEVKRDGNRISNPAFALIIYPENISDDAILSTNEVGVLEQWYLDQIAAMSPVKYTAQALTDEQKAQARENIGAAAVGESGGPGGSVTVDAALSETSTNPVQNKVVTAELNKKAAKSGYIAGKNVVTDADGNLATEEKPTALKNPNALTIKQGESEITYDGSGAVTVTIPGSSGGTVRVEKGSTDTAVELEPGKLYVFPEMSELSLTFAAPADTTVANEYHAIFRSGVTATVLTLPDTIKVPSGFSVEASKVYELSVLEGCLCAQSWAVTA